MFTEDRKQGKPGRGVGGWGLGGRAPVEDGGLGILKCTCKSL